MPVSDAISHQPVARRRVGVFGGTFDPPHVGHVLAGQSVAEAANLDEVWYVPANDPWQKSDERAVTPAWLRSEMLRQACQVSRSETITFRVSEVELATGGPSYTADTLSALRADHPGDDFVLIVGSDAAAGLHTWHAADWLSGHAEFLVYQRGGQPAEPAAGFSTTPVNVPLMEISSTEIRRRVHEGRSVRHLVPAPVEGLIAAYALYREPDAVS